MGMHPGRKLHGRMQPPVQPEAHHALALGRLHVDIRGAHLQGLDQDAVHQLDDGRFLRPALELVEIGRLARGIARFRAFHLGLVHALHGRVEVIALEQLLDAATELVGMREQRPHLLAQLEPNGVQGREIHRIGHRRHDMVFLFVHRQKEMIAAELLAASLQQPGGRIQRGRVQVWNLVDGGQRLDQLFGVHAVHLEQCRQQLALAVCGAHGLLDLLPRHHASLDQLALHPQQHASRSLMPPCSQQTPAKSTAAAPRL